MKYAVINTDGLVVNAAVWDGVSEFDAGAGMSLVPLPFEMATDDDGVEYRQYLAGPGWTYNGTDWTAPPDEESSEPET